MTTQTTQTLPHWQLTSLFPGLDSPEFREAIAQFRSDLEALERLMDEHEVRAREDSRVDSETIALFETLLERLNNLLERSSDLGVYLTGFVSTDAFNDEAQAAMSSLKPLGSKLGYLGKRFTAWTGSLEVGALLKASEAAKTHAYFVEESKVQAKHFMTDEAEALLSALGPTSGGAWGKLHGDLVSRHMVRATLPGRGEAEYVLTELKNLQSDEDPEVREAAYRAELELLERDEVSFAAAMNAIKGQVNEVTRRQGWDSALEEALYRSAISEGALDAVQKACKESFPEFRRYLKAKAKFLGKERLEWFDLNAPVSASEARHYTWDEAKSFIVTNFRRYSDRLADFAQHTFDKGWIDVPPRKGKRNGAFCMGAYGAKESRVMLNFGGTLDDLFTLAHELGHAYHNFCKYEYDRTPLQGNTPMTLAETASIFCETTVTNAVLESADETERLSVLEQDLLGATGLVVDIHSRFLFEKEVFARRLERELSVAEFKTIMLDAQAATYGEGLGTRHPYMWAHKGHYYSTGRSFYNFPYTFGYLFGLGLYARYREEPEGFHERYDELLASTGMADARILASSFGIDIESPDFWRDSLSIPLRRVDEFEQLVERLSP